MTGINGSPVFVSAQVYDAAGNLLSKTPLKSALVAFDYLPPDRWYSRSDDTSYDFRGLSDANKMRHDVRRKLCT